MILALGLELSDKPFLWVVRPDLNNNGTHIHPDGFEASVGSRGRMVGWAPQREVLVHPAIACFITHCGWKLELNYGGSSWSSFPMLALFCRSNSE
ncbi:hypothetical protein IFM89_008103 [Coptis chinensis]|uniref:Uncharacterized protein n=1 Tax=Coptis chinensis TaxID=261450 RepID=A0A835IUP5_9MAGN|nr:hypothetical protein IFM89_008103 [Coptis chinensis]